MDKGFPVQAIEASACTCASPACARSLPGKRARAPGGGARPKRNTSRTGNTRHSQPYPEGARVGAPLPASQYSAHDLKADGQREIRAAGGVVRDFTRDAEVGRRYAGVFFFWGLV